MTFVGDAAGLADDGGLHDALAVDDGAETAGPDGMTGALRILGIGARP